jgi:hypothetical protein
MRYRLSGSVLASLLVVSLNTVVSVAAQEDRIVTPDEVRHATRAPVFFLLRPISAPIWLLTSGMEKGLIKYETTYQRQRTDLWFARLRKRGITPYFGGTGEGTGFGGGLGYLLGGKRTNLNLVGRMTTTKYQDAAIAWTATAGISRFILEGSYQWRPRENFYGLGQDSVKEQRTNFSLRQTWAGVRAELEPHSGVLFGAEYRTAWLQAGPGSNPALASPDAVFPGLPGYGEQTRVRSLGSYLNLDGIRGEYQLGGAIHLGASYQEGLGASRLSYFNYEGQLEGRLPVAHGRSAFVGQATIELTRRRGGSDPIPFYMLPHIGGSSTLRGFRLDRFYGANLFLLSLEYRYRLHPNFDATPFFDEGQIFDRTEDLSWLDWHRNYGFGFRYHTETGTVLRLEIGHSSEALQFHIIWGDRERAPLRGPIRYGAYKR